MRELKNIKMSLETLQVIIPDVLFNSSQNTELQTCGQRTDKEQWKFQDETGQLIRFPQHNTSLSACPSICLSVHVSVCLSVYVSLRVPLSVSLSMSLCVSL